MFNSKLNGTCKYCGKRFSSFHIMGRVCNECYEKNKTSPLLTLIEKTTCEICGNEFFKTTYNNKYCSQKCKKAGNGILLKNYSASRFKIFQRDNFTCAYCGRTPIEHQVVLIVEHIFPRNKGGDNDLKNVITGCEECNLQKGDTVLPQETILKLWEITSQRNLQFDEATYKQLQAEFDRKYKVTQVA